GSRVLRFALMRAYKFLDAKFGLESIKNRRLKQSRVSDLNDPFELRSYDVTDLALRMTFLTTSKDVDKARGLLCFSADWRNPVIWAHYSDKHRGLCLGFEIPEMEQDQKSDAGFVKYVQHLSPFPSNFEGMSESERDSFARSALFTKYKDWAYEKEIRVWGQLTNEDEGLYFVPFGETLRLKDVIIGQRCVVSKGQILSALGPLAAEVKISKVRAAYDKFEMVEDGE
ncbi:MAG: DUF2971 domain-containing protein, partial [Candidatus Sulfotelmatobacter sp.]